MADQPITTAATERIVAALERAWDVQCSGHRNPDACESCRAYEDAITIVKAEATND